MDITRISTSIDKFNNDVDIWYKKYNWMMPVLQHFILYPIAVGLLISGLFGLAGMSFEWRITVGIAVMVLFTMYEFRMMAECHWITVSHTDMFRDAIMSVVYPGWAFDKVGDTVFDDVSFLFDLSLFVFPYGTLTRRKCTSVLRIHDVTTTKRLSHTIDYKGLIGVFKSNDETAVEDIFNYLKSLEDIIVEKVQDKIVFLAIGYSFDNCMDMWGNTSRNIAFSDYHHIDVEEFEDNYDFITSLEKFVR